MPKKVTKTRNIAVTGKKQGYWVNEENLRKGERTIKAESGKALVKRYRSGYEYDKETTGYELTKDNLELQFAGRRRVNPRAAIQDLSIRAKDTKEAPIMTAKQFFDFTRGDIEGIDTPTGTQPSYRNMLGKVSKHPDRAYVGLMWKAKGSYRGENIHNHWFLVEKVYQGGDKVDVIRHPDAKKFTLPFTEDSVKLLIADMTNDFVGLTEKRHRNQVKQFIKRHVGSGYLVSDEKGNVIQPTGEVLTKRGDPRVSYLKGVKIESQKKQQFEARVKELSKMINVNYKDLSWHYLDNKWGQTTSTKKLRFNPDVLDKGSKFQDKVIVHELLHLRYPNHSAMQKQMEQTYLDKLHREIKPKESKPYYIVDGTGQLLHKSASKEGAENWFKKFYPHGPNPKYKEQKWKIVADMTALSKAESVTDILKTVDEQMKDRIDISGMTPKEVRIALDGEREPSKIDTLEEIDQAKKLRKSIQTEINSFAKRHDWSEATPEERSELRKKSMVLHDEVEELRKAINKAEGVPETSVERAKILRTYLKDEFKRRYGKPAKFSVVKGTGSVHSWTQITGSADEYGGFTKEETEFIEDVLKGESIQGSNYLPMPSDKVEEHLRRITRAKLKQQSSPERKTVTKAELTKQAEEIAQLDLQLAKEQEKMKKEIQSSPEKLKEQIKYIEGTIRMKIKEQVRSRTPKQKNIIQKKIESELRAKERLEKKLHPEAVKLQSEFTSLKNKYEPLITKAQQESQSAEVMQLYAKWENDKEDLYRQIEQEKLKKK